MDTRILSPGRIAEIKARERAATKGPWGTWAHERDDGSIEWGIMGPLEIAEGIARNPRMPDTEDDAAFLAAARADVPALLAHAEAVAERADICLHCGHVEKEHSEADPDGVDECSPQGVNEFGCDCPGFAPLTADAYRAMRRAMLKDRETTRAIVEATAEGETIKQLRAVAAELRDVRKQLHEVTAERDERSARLRRIHATALREGGTFAGRIGAIAGGGGDNA